MEENRKAPFDAPLNKTLKDKFSFTFEVSRAGTYFIELTASAKNKKQNIYPSWAWRLSLPVLSIFGKDDDDLYVKIDNREFPKLDNVSGLYNAPAAWSGTSSRNTSKANVFILFLEKGAHTLTFHSDGTPTLQRIRCEKLETPQSFQYPIKYNNPPERKERSSWYTFTLVDLPLIQVEITARVEKRKKWLFFTEDDDVKIVLDGEIQQNEKPKAHKNWVFCARAQTGSSIFSSQPRWKPKLHYIELFADWTPTIEEISFNLIQSYKPYQDHDYNRFDKEILEAAAYWNSLFLKQRYPPAKPLDPNMVKAMVYYETGMGYHQGPNQPYPDVMQLGDPANPAMSALRGETPANEFIDEDSYGHTSYSYPEKRMPNVDTPKESIFWGVRWLYHKAQSFDGKSGKLEAPYVRKWKRWQKAVQLYNSDPEAKPQIGDPHYGENVFRTYLEGIDPRIDKELW